MAPSIRKAIGAVKDQTSIGIAKVSSNTAPDLEVAIVKATSHDDDRPASEKHIRQILNLTSLSRGYVLACVASVSRRLGKTRDWVVALKALTLLHRLLSEGDPLFQEEILHHSTRRRGGARMLNMSGFRDEAHSSSWDHSAFVRTYACYLDQKLELALFERKSNSSSHHSNGRGRKDDFDFRSPPQRSYDYENGGVSRRTRSYGDVTEMRGGGRAATPLPEMTQERIFGKMGHLQRLLDRFLNLRPTGLAKNSRMVLIALYPVVRESFKLYADICEVLAVLLDKFFDMEYTDCVKAFDAYASAAKQIDELIAFYDWCKETGVGRSSEYPEVQRITSKLLETLEEFVRDRAKRGKSPERKEIEPPPPPPPPVAQEEEPNMNEIKALPPPENYTPPPPPEAEPENPQYTEDLVDLREDEVTGDDDQGNKFALALFAGPPGSKAFPSDGVTSAWQNPAAEPGKADWELALVETASNLEKQTAALGGGFDSLLLNGMYDQGVVRQHVSTSQLTGGSASSVALPLPGKTNTQVLALPAPDGTVEKVNQDPFAASLTIPPPSYVQMAEMEKKQYLLSQEQQLWQQYQREGMRGQASLAKMNTGQVPGGMPYGMQPVHGMGPPPTGSLSG
ncbi:putative clathrin assembly protein At2g25430 isoform X2 [Raphanus sativus]|uniref:Clathrin assembly protein At2g25430 isoform X2 n=1 Tax=Raphanus sativus TaxID=3726 RepID=A0A9W3BWA0_RAPSA|nr:putative clathrin assembly protein At2g25430 isoform X2 [Raphanus sativus]